MLTSDSVWNYNLIIYNWKVIKYLLKLMRSKSQTVNMDYYSIFNCKSALIVCIRPLCVYDCWPSVRTVYCRLLGEHIHCLIFHWYFNILTTTELLFEGIMTVRYNQEIPTARFCGFLKLLFRFHNCSFEIGILLGFIYLKFVSDIDSVESNKSQNMGKIMPIRVWKTIFTK